MSTSQTENHFIRRESLALAVTSLVVVACAVVWTIGILLAGFALIDAADWFIGVTGG